MAQGTVGIVELAELHPMKNFHVSVDYNDFVVYSSAQHIKVSGCTASPK